MFQVSVEGGASYLSINERIYVAPPGWVFIHALLPYILPILFSVPDFSFFRIARILYDRVLDFLPPELKAKMLSYQSKSEALYLISRVDVEHCGGRYVFFPVTVDRKCALRRYRSTKIDPHFVQAVSTCPSGTSWFKKVATVCDLRGFDLSDESTTKAFVNLTAPVRAEKLNAIPETAVDEIIDKVYERHREWVPAIFND